MHPLLLIWSEGSARPFEAFFACSMLHSLLAVSCSSLPLVSQPDCLGAGCAVAAATFVGCCAGRSTETVVCSRTDAGFVRLSRQNRLGCLLVDLAGYASPPLDC